MVIIPDLGEKRQHTWGRCHGNSRGQRQGGEGKLGVGLIWLPLEAFSHDDEIVIEGFFKTDWAQT
jgi:hypothetical protein